MKIKEIETYLEEIRKSIYNISAADEFIEALRQQLYDYASDNPDLSLESLYHEFGDPDFVAKDFLENIEALEPKTVAKSKRLGKIKTFIIIVLAVTVIAGIIRLVDLQRHTQVMATDVITIEKE